MLIPQNLMLNSGRPSAFMEVAIRIANFTIVTFNCYFHSPRRCYNYFIASAAVSVTPRCVVVGRRFIAVVLNWPFLHFSRAY